MAFLAIKEKSCKFAWNVEVMPIKCAWNVEVMPINKTGMSPSTSLCEATSQLSYLASVAFFECKS